MFSELRPGGASASYTIESGTPASRPILPASSSSPSERFAPAAAADAPGRAVEWPRAGWGPGSLTISRPPRAAGASETVLSSMAVVAALKLSASAVPGVAGVAGGGGGMSESVGRAPGAGDGSGSGGGDGGNRGVAESMRGEHLASGTATGGEEGGDLAREGFNNRPEEGEGQGSALSRTGDDIIGRIFSSTDDTTVQECGFTTDGSKAVAEAAGASLPLPTVDGDGTGGVGGKDQEPGGEATSTQIGCRPGR